MLVLVVWYVLTSGKASEPIGVFLVVVFDSHVGRDGLHLGCVVREQFDFDFGTVGGFHTDKVEVVLREYSTPEFGQSLTFGIAQKVDVFGRYGWCEIVDRVTV
jgi:hypothetical protein